MATTQTERDFTESKHKGSLRTSKGPCIKRLDEFNQANRWEKWTTHLLRRPRLELLPPAKQSPLKWGLAGRMRPTSKLLLDHLHRFYKGKAKNTSVVSDLENWVGAAADHGDHIAVGLESIAWTHAMPQLAGILPSAPPWQQLLELLLDISCDSSAIDRLQWSLAQQLISGELPLVLACTFPEIKACRALLAPARRALSEGLLELLDGAGLPVGTQISWLRPLLACWTRCRHASAARGLDCFTEAAHDQFEWAVRQSCRLLRQDKSQVFTPAGGSPGVEAELLRAATRFVDDSKDHALVRFLAPARGRAAKKNKPPKSPKPSYHSEWAEAAMLRANWSPKSPLFAITYDAGQVVSELNLGGEVVWSGPWRTALEINAQPVEFHAEWAEVCWFSDKEVVYVELACEHPNHWKLERQILLGRDDRFLFLADALHLPQTADIRYQSSLPLTDSVRFEAEEESREGQLVGKRPLGLVMPLAAPEWRNEPSSMELDCLDHGQLTLTASLKTNHLYAPLMIDVDPRRFRYPYTWRRLTVADKLNIQSEQVAAGYRVQSGMKQWLIYRSLAAKSNRTVIGQNFCNEFYVGRFGVDGVCHELIEIE